jgi:hypothetical protein
MGALPACRSNGYSQSEITSRSRSAHIVLRISLL